MLDPDWRSKDLCIDISAHSLKKALVFSVCPGVCKAKKINLMACRQMPKLVERADPLSLVRRIWEPVRHVQNLHRALGVRIANITETSVRRAGLATWLS